MQVTVKVCNLVSAFLICDNTENISNNQMNVMSHRLATEAINLFVFNERPIKIGGEFLAEGYVRFLLVLLYVRLFFV